MLEYILVFIYGGFFVNIVYGCNSVIVIKMVVKLGDYVVIEVGFGVDLGVEKFLNIKVCMVDIKFEMVVIVVIICVLKMYGGVFKECLNEENIEVLEVGIENFEKYIEMIQVFGVFYVVVVNCFVIDLKDEVEVFMNWCVLKNVFVVLIEVWEKGGEGGVMFVEKIFEVMNEIESQFLFFYDVLVLISEKVEVIVKIVYGV